MGVGLGETALRFGERTVVSQTGDAQATYEPVDRYRALALGAATTGPVRLGLGATLAVDGGMSDNPRPVLYGSGYETFLPRAVRAERPPPHSSLRA